jgi:exosortase/archaeosortase family protein
LEWFGLQELFANLVSDLLNAFGVNNTLFTTMSSSLSLAPAFYIYSTGLVVIIDFACTGIRSAYLLFALLFSLDWSPGKQFKYLFIGLGILFLVNVFRIFSVTLLVIFLNLPVLFENFLWTGMLNITVFLILYYYLKH